MPTIVFVNEGKAGVVAEGTTVLQAALDLGVKISHVCGGWAARRASAATAPCGR